MRSREESRPARAPGREARGHEFRVPGHPVVGGLGTALVGVDDHRSARVAAFGHLVERDGAAELEAKMPVLNELLGV